MIDLNSKTHLNDRICHYIDGALQAEAAAETPRNYLGASAIGGPCDRQLQYSVFGTAKTRTVQGHVIRTRERGHWVEAAAARWYRMGGFTLVTEHTPGEQIEVSFLNGRFKGHMDGVFLSGPMVIPYPCLWECKGLKKEHRTPLTKKRVRKYFPGYWAQMQIYMGGMGLKQALFSVWFPNDMKPYHELVEFDEAGFNQYLHRAQRILMACDHGELLPRCSDTPNYQECKWCDYGGVCWA